MKKKKLYIIFAVLVILGSVAVYGILKNDEQEIYKGTAIITESSLYSKAVVEVKDEEGNVVGKAKVYSEGFLKDDELKVEYTKSWGEIKIIKFESDLYKNEDGKTNPNPAKENIVYNLNKPINIKNIAEDDKIDLIASLVKSKANKNFDVDNYIIERLELSSGTVFYNFNLKINSVKCNIGYVVQVNEKEGIIVEISDNMIGYVVSKLIKDREDSIKMRLNNLTESQKEKLRKKALENKVELNEFDRALDNEQINYDVKEDKLYYVVNVEIKDDGKILTNYDYYEEIK